MCFERQGLGGHGDESNGATLFPGDGGTYCYSRLKKHHHLQVLFRSLMLQNRGEPGEDGGILHVCVKVLRV